MRSLPTSPLDRWNARRIGLEEGRRLTPDHIAEYQLKQLNRVLAYTAQCSPYYRKLWGGTHAPGLERLDQLAALPFTTEEVLRNSALQLLCVSQSEVSRVVTLHTSGTTGNPKRVFFTDADIERIIDFFHHGLAAMACPNQRLLILLPGNVPESAANLLQQAAARMNVTAFVYGLVDDPARAIQTIIDHNINCLAGIPVQVLALARHPDAGRIPSEMIQSVLLSTDYVPQAIARAIGDAWNCAVFQHYGMTEMGFGAAMSCAAQDGYHLREADLLFEIIDPISGQPLPDGQPGEVVFTTLNHQAMPLIRYRTGDLAAITNRPCPCGSTLRRMTWVQGRKKERIHLKNKSVLEIKSLDEALFALPQVVNFKVKLQNGPCGDRLQITLFTACPAPEIYDRAHESLARIPALNAAMAAGALVLDPILIEQGMGGSDAVVKRRIMDNRVGD